METETLQIIIQGGAVGIAVILIIKDFLQVRTFNKTFNNHLKHLTEVIASLDKTMQSQTKTMENNGRIMERVERVLDK